MAWKWVLCNKGLANGVRGILANGYLFAESQNRSLSLCSNESHLQTNHQLHAEAVHESLPRYFSKMLFVAPGMDLELSEGFA